MRDLRSWLQQVEQMGELQVISQELDWNEETSALNYMVAQQEGAPALLFEKLKDAAPGFRTLHNLFGTSKERIALTFGLPLGTPLRELIHRVRTNFRRKLPPTVVSGDSAVVNENVIEGKQVDITMFPAPKMWPLDGGR